MNRPFNPTPDPERRPFRERRGPLRDDSRRDDFRSGSHRDHPADRNRDADEPPPPVLSPRTGREAAYLALEEFRNSGNWLADVLDRIFRQAGLPPQEKGLGTELACGVMRRQATLDAILRQLITRPLVNVELPLLNVLRLGLYQIVILDGIAPHAAVNETVELTKRLGQMRWSGFVNGVLRGATRFVTNTFDTTPSQRGVPVSGGRYRRLVEPAFPNPDFSPAIYFAEAFSFPDWLSVRWAARMKPAALWELGMWLNSPGKLVLRVNLLRTTVDEFAAALQERGLNPQRVPDSNALILDEAAQIERLPGYDEGWFAVHDLTAMRAAERLAPQPGSRVWDVCAAPGGKTCHLAELMRNQGEIIATDVREDRLALVEENVRRLRAGIVRTRLMGEDGSNAPPGLFDAILLDVPCSNTGVLGKRPEARWRIAPAGISELNRTQERLLNGGLDRLAPQGRLLYSTCSIEPEENELLVRRVLSQRTAAGKPPVEVLNEQLSLPGQPTDGGYQALLMHRPA